MMRASVRGWMIGGLGLLLLGCEGQLSVELGRGDTQTVERFSPRIVGLELRDEGGNLLRIDSEALRDLDLQTLASGERRVLVGGDEIVAGRYTGVRLRFAGSGGQVRFRGSSAERPLQLVTGDFAPINLRLNEDDDQTLRLVLEPQFSLTPPADASASARLRPVLRAIVADQARTLSGRVATTLVEGPECRNSSTRPALGAAVYLYAADAVGFNDYLEGGAFNPLAAASLRFEGEAYRYRLMDVAAGSYTLALVCAADLDRPQTNEGLATQRLIAVTVADEDVEVDLD
jgi:hypothetical protein